MKGIERLAGFIGLILMLAFFAPYVVKLPQLDITLILLGAWRWQGTISGNHEGLSPTRPARGRCVRPRPCRL